MLCNHGSDPLVAASPLIGLPLVYSAFCGNYTLCLVGKQQVNSLHLGAIFFYIFLPWVNCRNPIFLFQGVPKVTSRSLALFSCREKCARAKRKQKNEEPPGGWISFFFPGEATRLTQPVGRQARGSQDLRDLFRSKGFRFFGSWDPGGELLFFHFFSLAVL